MPAANESLVDWLQGVVGSGSLRLPVFSDVALEVQRVGRDGTAGLDEVERVIQRDQTLVAEVLRAANSSFFGGLTQAQTVRAALVRLGLEQVSRIVFFVTEEAKYRLKNPHLAELAQMLWWHSAATAMAGQWLAHKLHRKTLTEEVFLGGLVHDIGKLAILTALDELATKDGELPSRPLIDEVLTTMHERVGETLLTGWKIPDVYVRIARSHHDEALDPNDTALVLVRLADQAARKTGVSLTPDASLLLSATPEAHAMGASEVMLAELEIVLEDGVESLRGEKH